MTGFSQPVPPSESALPACLRALIVEDVPADAELLLMTLETAGVVCTAEIVDSLSDCEQLLREQTWDVVLADFRLQGFNAYKVLEQLQQVGQNIPLILVTGSLGEEAAVECIKAGMTDYVLKDRLFRLPTVLARSLREFELKRQQRQAIAQIHQQAQREAIINRIVQAMRETLVLDEVMQTTVDMLHDAVSPDRCLLVRPQFKAERLMVCNISTESIEREDFLGTHCGIYPYYMAALRQGQIVAVSQLSEFEPPARDLAAHLKIEALLMVPLLYQQEFLGALSLHQRNHRRAWTDHTIEMVMAIANQCAIAIHQAQLFEQVQQQAQREQLLNRISRTINSSLDSNYILQEIVRLTGECFGVDRVAIFIAESRQVRVLQEWLANDQVISMLDFTTPIEGFPALFDPQTGDFSREAFHVPDYASLEPTPARQDLLHTRKTRSVLSVPIFFGQEFLGGLELYTTFHQRTFSESEIHLLQQIADQAAIALYNAQSYERLEQLVQSRTRELEAEKQLSDAANRAKSEFLANMSHELRTPLTGILGFSSVLLKQIFGPLTEKQQQYIENISTCGDHLLSLINDLLDLSKIEAGREELIFEPVDVRELCDTCASLIHEQACSQGLEVNLAIAPEVDTCVADQRRLKQILVNLLSNAVKFTEMGSVTLKVEEMVADGARAIDTGHSNQNSLKSKPALAKPMVTFQVIDTGIGISPENLSLLFQPFQQLDGGLDRKYQGTGLGLVLARKLAQLHQGDITVESEPGKGSCFTLHLPKESVTERKT